MTAIRKPKGSVRKWCFRILAMIGGPLLFFCLVELFLRIFGVGYETDFLVRNPDAKGQLRDNHEFAWRFFPRQLARRSQPILLEKKKPEGTRRIFVCGGSAIMGDPEPAFGFSRVLGVLLEARFPDEDFEIVNTAMTAINSHVVREIVDECRDRDPDLFIVYMGNNEVYGPFGAGSVFGSRVPPQAVIRGGLAARKTSLGQLLAGLMHRRSNDEPQAWGGLEMFLEQQLTIDDPALDRVYENYRTNLNAVISMAVDSGTPIVVSNVAVNLRDFPPFASNEGEGNALSVYREGRALLKSGDQAGAAEKLKRARDLDTLRLRTDSRLNEIAEKIASGRTAERVYFADAVASFAEAAVDGIPGEEFVYEHVHLTFAGNYLLATTMAPKAVEALGLALPENGDWLAEEACARQLGLTPWHRMRNLERNVERLQRAPFSGQSGHAERMERIEQRLVEMRRSLTVEVRRASLATYEELIGRNPSDWILREQFADLLESTGDFAGAAGQLSQVAEKLPHRPEVWYRLGAIRNREKNWAAAEKALRRALELEPQYPQALNSLGICRSHQSDFEESYASFEKAVEIMPHYAQAHFNWGLVLASRGENEAAAERYKDAISANADHLPAHQNLGQFHTKRGELAEAEVCYREVVRLAPESAPAHINLALVCFRQSKKEDAVKFLERALELDPSSTVAREYLEKAHALP